MQNNEVKKIDFQLKEESEGKVSAVFSVFNSLDSDGDVVEPGAIKSGFKSGNVPMVWAHKWDMPIGKGYITEDNDKATFTGEFFMDTESGQEAYKIVKNMGDMQQWSFGYRVNDSEYGKLKKDGSDNEEDVRFLKDLTVFEVSPVLVGANQETYTLAIKSNNDLLKDINEDVKSVMTTESMNQPDPNEKQEKDLHEDNLSDNEEQAMKLLNDMANDMKVILNAIPLGEDADLPQELKDSVTTLSERARTIGNIFTTEEIYEDPAKALAAAEESGKTLKIVDNDGNTYYKVSDIEEDVEEGTTVSFSRQVKDVLAAFNDLMARATAIAMLRAKDGRKLGMKATDALRAVQEDLQESWNEVDEFITNYGAENAEDVSEVEEAEAVVEEPKEEVETPTETEVLEPEVIEPEEDTEEEEEAVEAEPAPAVESEEEVAEAEVTEVDEESDALWAEGQAIIAESLEAEIIEE
jgi:HK97 family phage prohead protease